MVPSDSAQSGCSTPDDESAEANEKFRLYYLPFWTGLLSDVTHPCAPSRWLAHGCLEKHHEEESFESHLEEESFERHLEEESFEEMSKPLEKFLGMQKGNKMPVVSREASQEMQSAVKAELKVRNLEEHSGVFTTAVFDQCIQYQ